MWGEFGRSPKIYFEPGKKTAGRDHHGPANFVLFRIARKTCLR
jgi:hypothetical protein